MKLRHAWVHPDDVVHDQDGAHVLVAVGETVDDYGHRDEILETDEPVRQFTGPQRIMVVDHVEGDDCPGCGPGVAEDLGTGTARRGFFRKDGQLTARSKSYGWKIE